VTAGGATFVVREMDGRRVETLGMELPPPAAAEENADEDPDRRTSSEDRASK
jgi:hypothetical protein